MAIGIGDALTQILGVLAEAFEGPRDRWSYFTDTARDSGLFGSLAKLDAAAASRVIGRTSIAAHVNHLIFGLHASARWVEGDRTTHSWTESWSVSQVDETAWKHMREQLRAAYTDMNRVIRLFATANEEAMGGVLGALAHAAYHLGAIRQKISVTAAE